MVLDGVSTQVSLSQIFNPPLLGIAAGIAIGMSPLAPPLFCPAPVAKAAAARLPMELNTCLGISQRLVSHLFDRNFQLHEQSLVRDSHLRRHCSLFDQWEQSAGVDRLLTYPPRPRF